MMIRHGATKSNGEHRYLGRTEEALSIEGKNQLLNYKQFHCYPSVQHLFSSPMKRCIETADILYPNLQPAIIPEWGEMDFGAFEGKNHMELKDDTRYQAWIDSNGTLPFPDGESREDFILRCARGFERMTKEINAITKQNKSQEKTIATNAIASGIAIGDAKIPNMIIHITVALLRIPPFSFCSSKCFSVQLPRMSRATSSG